jgi:hypothetical protein
VLLGRYAYFVPHLICEWGAGDISARTTQQQHFTSNYREFTPNYQQFLALSVSGAPVICDISARTTQQQHFTSNYREFTPNYQQFTPNY